ncbi:HEAT repeat domain-containing protein, partial [candidate division WOR-3 bacterium]|nr:HEAT repeat domain-containing protein [candidate division WOR-3 bacterium]
DLEGDDQYRLACDTAKDGLGGMPGCGQGGALSFRAYPWEKKLTAYGGVGLLVDDKGNDTYVSEGWCSQGGSYIMSLGALVDNAGNDHYDCGTGQGSGIHVTNSILIDKKGDDVYEGGFRSGGSGGDRSPGFLIDYEGNDTYRSSTSSYGTGCKPFCFSLFIDYKGDDRYICARPESTVLSNDWHSFGGVWPESDPNLWPYAICLDLGGTDDYQVRNRRNNSETHSFGHGIFLDTEWKGGDVIGEVERPYPADRWDAEFHATSTVPIVNTMQELRLHVGPLAHFNTIGRVAEAGSDAIPHVCTWLAAQGAEKRPVHRDLMECLHYRLAQGRIGGEELPYVLGLLQARDPEVRLTVADDLGLWNIRQAESALVAVAATDSVGQVRRFALRSLMRLESKKGLETARRLATEDTCEDVRRVAVGYIGRVRDSVDVFPLLRWALAEDGASSGRCAAADAMRQLQDERGIEPLRAAAQTYDVYVRRACGRALAELGQVEGIQLLIRSLSFPSIDAFYNYDRN